MIISEPSKHESRTDLTQRLGNDLVGPVIHHWLLNLHQHIAYFTDDQTAFLFCARAGVRIQRLYNMFLAGRHFQPVGSPEIFWVSRLAVGKGTYNKQVAAVTKIISDEYYHSSLRELVQGVLRNHPDKLDKIDLSGSALGKPGVGFSDWLGAKSAPARAVESYLDECSETFAEYLKDLVGHAKRVVLIDSGWQGTSQSLLTHAFPEYDWKGLYFGRIMTPKADMSIRHDIVGLMFEAEAYDPSKPATAFVLHRHLIETLLEPNGPSVEDIYFGPSKAVVETQVQQNLTDPSDESNEPLFHAVTEYLRRNADLSATEIVARGQTAMEELAQWLAFPSSDQATATITKSRSADFGKDLLVPVLLSKDHPKWSDSDLRVQHALWPSGQVALEYVGGVARELQARIAGLSSNQASFDPKSSKDKHQGAPATSAVCETGPTVAVITRTKNRPIMLERAARSVASQTYGNIQWVVVNDGGDEEVVRQVIEASSVDRQKITLVSNSHSLGMEAASNAGIRNSDSDYLVIHDDDDSWDPRFVETCITKLESPSGDIFGGVITGTVYVSEEIKGDEIIEHHRMPYNSWVKNVQLSEMMRGNFFAPISFLYRRSIFDEIGGYNENLPVLGDWYFNVEFLLQADVAVLDQPMAYYHHRDQGDASRNGVYSNSVIGGKSKHEEYAAVARNMLLRKYSQKSALVVGLIDGYFAAGISHQLSQSPTAGGASGYDEIDRLWLISNLLKRRRQRLVWMIRGLKAPSVEMSWPQVVRRWNLPLCEVPIHPSFDEQRYLEANHDVAAAVRSAHVRSGYEHYLRYGREEKRPRTNRAT